MDLNVDTTSKNFGSKARFLLCESCDSFGCSLYFTQDTVIEHCWDCDRRSERPKEAKLSPSDENSDVISNDAGNSVRV